MKLLLNKFYYSFSNLFRLIEPAKKANTTLVVIGIFIGAFMTGLHTRMIGVSIADLKGVMGLSYDEGSWLNTLLNAAQLLTAPVIPLLASVIGVRSIVMTSTISLALTCVLTLYVHDITAIFILHIIQGASLGVYLSLTMTLAFRYLPNYFWGLIITIYSFRLVFGINTGTPVSGLFIEDFRWGFIYITTALLSILSGWMIIKNINESDTNFSRIIEVDFIGVFLFSSGLFLIYLGLDQGERLDWFGSGVIVSLLLCGFVLFSFSLIRAHFSSENHFPDVSGISNKNVILGLLIGCFSGFLVASNAVLITGFLSAITDLKVAQTGWTLYLVVLGFLTAVPVHLWLVKRIDTRIILGSGIIITMIAAYSGTFLTSQWQDENFIITAFLYGIGHCFTFSGMITFIVCNTNPKNTVSMLAFIPIVRIIFPCFAGACLAAWLRIQGAYYSLLLGENVKVGDNKLIFLEKSISDRLASTGLNNAANEAITRIVKHEADVLTFIDGYYLTILICFLCILITFAMRPSPPNPIVKHLQKK